ncbi:MAG TPA: AAA family ATPase [Candidatus Omnitrophota bacterium]|nr:AAA family ATPase [Candidatus Omnitrophota bacterium]
MSYYKLLGFEREPFSTSPDPSFLYLTREHDLALTNVLIQMRLKRGLNVILGDVGTGKTTLSRKLVTELKERDDFVFHIILDPTFESEKEFLYSLIRNYNVPFNQDFHETTVSNVRNAFESFLLHKNLNENKTVVLIIDESQKLSDSTLESLRVLLNYETNDFKLIQIVLMGQLELCPKIIKMPNFYDRIDFRYTLNPLGFEETKELIEFRIRQAGFKEPRYLFLDDAIREIYYATKGYPRGIIRKCHSCLRALIMSKTKTAVDRELVLQVLKNDSDAIWNTMAVQRKESY